MLLTKFNNNHLKKLYDENKLIGGKNEYFDKYIKYKTKYLKKYL
jgi:hypothetical protein